MHTDSVSIDSISLPHPRQNATRLPEKSSPARILADPFPPGGIPFWRDRFEHEKNNLADKSAPSPLRSPTRRSQRKSRGRDVWSRQQLLVAAAEHLRRNHKDLASVPQQQFEALVDRLPLRLGKCTSLGCDGAAEEYVTTRLREGQHLQLAPPATKPSSGSAVFGVYAADRAVAFLKVYRTGPAPFLRELVANCVLRQTPDAPATVRIFDFGRLTVDGKARPFILMEAAKGDDIESLMKKVARAEASLPELIRAATAAGRAAAALHKAFPASSDTGELAAVRRYHSDYIARLLGPEGALKACTERGLISLAASEQLQHYVARTLRAYNETPPSQWRATVVHGDYHAGNVLHNATNNTTQLIDTETLAFALGKDASTTTGIGDPLEDIGRFIESITMAEVRFKLSRAAAAKTQEAFLSAYSQAIGVDPDELTRDLAFYRLRYDAVIVTSVARCWQQNQPTAELKVGERAAKALLLRLLEHPGIV